jgi:hypothetical protein
VNLYRVVALIVVATIVAALATRILFRHVFTDGQAEHAERTVPFLLGSIGGFFGLVGGLLLSSSWNDLRALRQSMTSEIGSLAVVDRVAGVLPPPLSAEVHDDVVAYVHSVVQVELPEMSMGRIDTVTARNLGNIWLALARYNPQSPAQVSIRALGLQETVDVAKARQERIAFRRENLPVLLWLVLIASGGAVIIGACTASVRHTWPVPPFLAALAGLIALILFSIHALHSPFDYHLSTPSSEYMRLWEVFRGPISQDDTVVPGNAEPRGRQGIR